jgi:hypothetical protein
MGEAAGAKGEKREGQQKAERGQARRRQAVTMG